MKLEEFIDDVGAAPGCLTECGPRPMISRPSHLMWVQSQIIWAEV